VSQELEIDAKPYAFTCDLSHTALLIIDMQQDFLAPGGFGERLGNDLSLVRECISPVRQLLDAFRTKGLFVLYTREGHRPDLSDCPPSKLARSQRQGAGIGDEGPMGRLLVRGEKGHAIIPELAPIPGEPIIDKPGKGAFFSTDLDLILRNKAIDSLIVTGVTTHVCVSTTVREGSDRGYECLVVADGTAAFDPEDRDATLWQIQQQGAIFGWVSDSHAILTAINERTDSA